MKEERLIHYPRRSGECLIQIQHLPSYLSNDFSGDQHLLNISSLSWGSTASPRGGMEIVGLGCAHAAVGRLRAAACSQLSAR